MLSDCSCFPCVSGSYYSSGSCMPCSQGMFNDKVNQPGCATCPAGYYGVAVGAKSRWMCEPCLAGTTAAPSVFCTGWLTVALT